MINFASEPRKRLRRRNRRRNRIKHSADNPFTAYTGIPVVKLSGTSDCWVCGVGVHKQVPSRKVSYAAHHGWQPYEMEVTAQRMKLLRVKQTCGVDQCVNPDHLVGTEREFDPLA